MSNDFDVIELMGYMDIISSNLNLNGINFLENLSMEFEFINREGRVTEKITCTNVLDLKIELVGDDMLPLFICDIRFLNIKTHSQAEQFLNYFNYGFQSMIGDKNLEVIFMDSGDVCISVLCEEVTRIVNNK
ncbi:hypothetical protein [Vallitalea guaymasensis]|uniref:Uncharacterized protein n=1 Tax=Vallitalea guaymasensis TaxID=1185412 RepID=A0A8J8MBC4_9FIRM|nr:hypothetical protein [Vallitalea guaymasensis]QUH29778.1 hypothetical protein HYG85_13025 [Vallitalea guaymasensis]